MEPYELLLRATESLGRVSRGMTAFSAHLRVTLANVCKIHNRDAQVASRRPVRKLFVVAWTRMAAEKEREGVYQNVFRYALTWNGFGRECVNEQKAHG